MKKRIITKRRLMAEKEGLIGVAISMITMGFMCFQSHYTQRDQSAYLGMAAGAFFVGVGFLILIGRGYLKFNYWAPEHIQLIDTKTLKVQAQLKKSKEKDLKGVSK